MIGFLKIRYELEKVKKAQLELLANKKVTIDEFFMIAGESDVT